MPRGVNRKVRFGLAQHAAAVAMLNGALDKLEELKKYTEPYYPTISQVRVRVAQTIKRLDKARQALDKDFTDRFVGHVSPYLKPDGQSQPPPAQPPEPAASGNEAA